MSLIQLRRKPASEVNLKQVYDCVVVGSGAAGGMAAHVLTSHGLKVLLLEAGKKLDLDKELKSSEWPYEHPRRGQMPPGARAAQAAAYIDRRLAESLEEETKQLWRGGLKLIDALSEQMHARPFMQASREQQVAVLSRISQNEAKPQKPEELFFTELKARTAYAYYTSKIGIHQELEYKGNTYLKEFAGYDAT